MKNYKVNQLSLILIFLSFIFNAYSSDVFTESQLNTFIKTYSAKYKIPANFIEDSLTEAEFQDSTYNMQVNMLESSKKKPKPWSVYRRQFINQRTIDLGADFYCEYKPTFKKAQAKYGVPPEIILGILGVETSYGGFTGHYRMIDTLTTLAFNSPRRVDFFQDELANYLAMCYENHLNPTKLIGAIDGGFGLAQFMPSSYRQFAVGDNEDKSPDLFSPKDAILSIANYFNKHGWQRGGNVILDVKISPKTCKNLICDQKFLSYPIVTWQKNGVIVKHQASDTTTMASVITLQSMYRSQAWLALNNFFVIFAYNHSHKYAMVVYQLGNAVLKQVSIDGSCK